MSNTVTAWIYPNPFNIIKRWHRRRQKMWAMRLASRIVPICPLGITCRNAGWMPCYEPFTEWRELEWVELRRDIGEHCSISHHFVYPHEPTTTELGEVFCRLMNP